MDSTNRVSGNPGAVHTRFSSSREPPWGRIMVRAGWHVPTMPTRLRRVARSMPRFGDSKEAWRTVAGDGLWSRTQPVRFCGRKGRRLLVAYSPGPELLWGTWDGLAAGPTRRAFTEFRLRVNTAIAPHLVDHVDFICTEGLREERSKAGRRP